MDLIPNSQLLAMFGLQKNNFLFFCVNDDWQMKEELLVFKFLEVGESLSVAFINYWKTLELLIACLL